MKRTILTAAVLTVAGAAATATIAAAVPGGPDRAPARCASVVIASRTPTGHEADLPVTVCGGIGKTGSYQCAVTTSGGLKANARLECEPAAQP